MVAALCAPQRRRLGVISLSCGNVAALALLFHSPLWLWELNETWPVQPVAALARANPGGEIRLKGYDERPSLNWYAEQRIQRFKGGPGRRLSDKPRRTASPKAKRGDGPWPTVGSLSPTGAHCVVHRGT